ncbi:hypothetical protein KC323_g269 [Hortaea werneckii]|nr:hypothetical protein KC323_g269 [Hortaea werneckii]
MMTQQPEDIRSRFTDEESLAEAMHVDGQLLRLGVGDAHRPHSTRTAVFPGHLATVLIQAACHPILHTLAFACQQAPH